MAASEDKPKACAMPVNLLICMPLLPRVLRSSDRAKRQSSRLACQLDNSDRRPSSNNYSPHLMTFITANM
jgi:hypothetical protein